MSLARVTRGLVLGALGGFLGWMVVEWGAPLLGQLLGGLPFIDPQTFVLTHDPLPGETQVVVTFGKTCVLGALVGLGIGFWLGVAQGMEEGTAGKLRRSVLVSSGLGLVGGFLGLGFGQLLYGELSGSIAVPTNPAAFVWQLFARSISWSLIGLFVGIAVSMPGLSFRRILNGALGGWLGGLIGGFVFQSLASTMPVAGWSLRAIGFTVIGAAVGLFINLVAEAFKRTWVKVLVGRNEGREHVLDKPICVFGRDELVEIPVYLDPQLPKRQATFRQQGKSYALYPEPTGLPMTVNGQPVQPGQLLRDGDAIQAGGVTLAYYDKVTVGQRQGRPVGGPTPAMAPVSGPAVAEGVCAYCGQVKDPVTGACACSVPAEAAAPGGVGAPPAPAFDPAATQYAAGPLGGGPDSTQLAAPMVEDSGQGPRLVGLRGPYNGLVYDLPAIEISLGREAGRDIELSQDASTSRHHADLSPAGGTFVVRDAGSSNGTFVNGVRVQEQALQPGDEVQIGNNVFRFLT